MSTSLGPAKLKFIFGKFVLILVNSYSFEYEYESTKMSTNWPKWVRIDQMSTNWQNFSVRIDQNEYELTWVRIDWEPMLLVWRVCNI